MLSTIPTAFKGPLLKVDDSRLVSIIDYGSWKLGDVNSPAQINIIEANNIIHLLDSSNLNRVDLLDKLSERIIGLSEATITSVPKLRSNENGLFDYIVQMTRRSTGDIDTLRSKLPKVHQGMEKEVLLKSVLALALSSPSTHPMGRALRHDAAGQGLVNLLSALKKIAWAN